jgi:hypothetical protein
MIGYDWVLGIQDRVLVHPLAKPLSKENRESRFT